MFSYITRLLERDFVTFVGLVVWLAIFSIIGLGFFRMFMGIV